jgi:hypothetical protein
LRTLAWQTTEEASYVLARQARSASSHAVSACRSGTQARPDFASDKTASRDDDVEQRRPRKRTVERGVEIVGALVAHVDDADALRVDLHPQRQEVAVQSPNTRSTPRAERERATTAAVASVAIVGA